MTVATFNGGWRIIASFPSWDYGDIARTSYATANPGDVVRLRYERGLYFVEVLHDSR